MRRDLLTAAISVVVLTVLLGLLYPLAMTGASQVIFPSKADGSKVTLDGKAIGSSLIGQDFRKPVIGRDGRPETDADGNPVLAADPKYFQSRPSADSYNPSATAFSNLGPNSKALRDQIAANADAYMRLEGPYDSALRRDAVPNDAVQTSASGVDPEISIDNADIQAHRVAAVRQLPLTRVNALVDQYTDGRDLGVMGDPGVNVLELNLALDRESAR
ncbi:MAG TPA: potassium-transporting ATPase subunit C [Conexibacter sp.]|jgi:K+-transporting ATPase ATPase C chain